MGWSYLGIFSSSMRSQYTAVLMMSKLQQFFFLTAWYLVILHGKHLSTSSHEHPLWVTQLKFQHTPHGKEHVSRILYLAQTVTHNSWKFPLMSSLLWQMVTNCTQKKHFAASSRGSDKIFIGVADVLILFPPKQQSKTTAEVESVWTSHQSSSIAKKHLRFTKVHGSFMHG